MTDFEKRLADIEKRSIAKIKHRKKWSIPEFHNEYERDFLWLIEQLRLREKAIQEVRETLRCCEIDAKNNLMSNSARDAYELVAFNLRGDLKAIPNGRE